MLQSKVKSKLLLAFGVAIMSLALLVPAAGAATPAPGYERFTGCPTPEENATTTNCIYSVVKGGHFLMGNKEVPISKPIPLTGGVDTNIENYSHNSEGGLAPVEQEVPGGLIGLTGLDWLVNFLGAEALKLYAVTELAGTPILGPTDLVLPIKARMVNPALGSNCYVGSDANPIMLNMTTGTTEPPPPNEPITGVAPKLSFDIETGVISFKGGTYVDNAFAAPGASGCKLSLLGLETLNIDSTINVASGLPSAAGTNETVQEIDTEIANRTKVYP